MALVKQPIAIDFKDGLNQKIDPNQLPPGKFLALNNVVQNKLGLLQKRNGFQQLTSLPDLTYNYLTTFNGNLTAISTNLAAYIAGDTTWVTKGNITPLNLSTLPLIRTNTNQSQSDIAISPNNFVCTAYTDAGVFKVAVSDALTGQSVVLPYTLVADVGVVSGAPRVYSLGNYFIVLYSTTSGGVDHLVYTSISTQTLAVSAPVVVSITYVKHAGGSFDAVIASNGFLYMAWSSATTIEFTYLNSILTLATTANSFAFTATLVNLAADLTSTSIYCSFLNGSSTIAHTGAFDTQLNILFVPTAITIPSAATNLAAAATNGLCTVMYEITHAYSYDSAIASNYIESVTVTSSGTAGTPAVFKRSVGLASKLFVLNSIIYGLFAYSSLYQPGYFLINGSGTIVAQLAYGNGGGYVPQLPNLLLNPQGGLSTSYLIKDLIQAVNKNTNVPSGSQVAGIYSQTGINLVNFNINPNKLISSEIGNNLNLTGGFLWAYDGYQTSENDFFVWPDSIEVTTATGSGNLTAQQYFYQVTYEWTDNQGNAFRSAPSIPVSVTTTTSSSTNTINIPTLRLTNKATSVKLVVYRWSVAQQSYYQVTSISSPTLNDPTIDSIAFSDTLADSTILGNNLIYTTGGVVENVSGPSSVAMTLFDTRLWLVDAEDQSLLWYSKQVIESTPVEMSDLFTIYVPPSTGTGGSTGVMRCLAPMDDKLIIFKDNAIYYINGSGPDNTGANSQYSQATFITTTVGCSNQKSIVLTPQGLMFQSNNGIWLLSRNLQTSYIGAPVADSNSNTVLSSINVPETNQIRFNMSNSQTLVYNYYFDQWSTFSGIAPISSVSYGALNTFIDALGRCYQENPGSYLDGSNPVLISFTTSWFNLAGLQGFQRFYYMQLLGTYYSPHTLVVSLAYDYATSPSQQISIQPDNFSPAWGSDVSWGSGAQWGGNLPLEQWQIFPQQQKCQAFQVSIQEVFDSTLGAPAGAGFTMSGLNMVIGSKKGYNKLPSSRQAG